MSKTHSFMWSVHSTPYGLHECNIWDFLMSMPYAPIHWIWNADHRLYVNRTVGIRDAGESYIFSNSLWVNVIVVVGKENMVMPG